MDISGNEWNDVQEDQINFWLEQPTIPTHLYHEPKLEESTIEVIKLVCDVLHQTDEVFITSVDVLEEYVSTKSVQKREIPNSVLTIMSAILISSKLIGSHPEIKLATIQTVVMKLTKTGVDKDLITQTELDIFLTLGKLPLATTATDLSIFLEYYVRSLKLVVHTKIQSLCLDILNVVYISRKKLMLQLKLYYTQSKTSLLAFQRLVCNKLYFPAGVILCALRVTKLKGRLELNQIVQDMGKICSIHFDHLKLLAGTIYEILDLEPLQ